MFDFDLTESANHKRISHKTTSDTKASDGHSYVNSVASVISSNGGGSCVQHAQSSSSSGSRRCSGDQRDYVNQPISAAHHHHHHHPQPVSSQQSRDSVAHQKHRRTQKRVTHNEKRYHSGNGLSGR